MRSLAWSHCFFKVTSFGICFTDLFQHFNWWLWSWGINRWLKNLIYIYKYIYFHILFRWHLYIYIHICCIYILFCNMHTHIYIFSFQSCTYLYLYIHMLAPPPPQDLPLCYPKNKFMSKINEYIRLQRHNNALSNGSYEQHLWATYIVISKLKLLLSLPLLGKAGTFQPSSFSIHTSDRFAYIDGLK